MNRFDDDLQASKETLVKLMAIADRLDTRNRQIAEQLAATTIAMNQGAIRLNEGSEQFARQALQIIGSGARQTVAREAELAVAQLQRQLEQSTRSAQAAARTMQQESKSLTGARRAMLWNALLALLLGSLLAAGGAAWVAHNSMQEIAQADFGRDILRAARTGAITHCGEQLCARVGKKARRYGIHGEYALLQP